jgi:hypothetical protein
MFGNETIIFVPHMKLVNSMRVIWRKVNNINLNVTAYGTFSFNNVLAYNTEM